MSKINFLPDDHTLFGLTRRYHTSQSIVLNLFQWCTDLIQKFPSNYCFQGCPAGRKNITMKVIFTSTQKIEETYNKTGQPSFTLLPTCRFLEESGDTLWDLWRKKKHSHVLLSRC